MSSRNPVPSESKFSPSRAGQPDNYLKFRKDAGGRGGYVSKLPFWMRYYKPLVIAGSVLTFCITFSAPLYNIFIRDPKDYDYQATLWPSEIIEGKTKVEKFREKLQRIEAEKQAKRAAKEARKAEKEAAKAAKIARGEPLTFFERWSPF